MLRGMATVSFWAADYEAAKRWYTEFLGMSPISSGPAMSSSESAIIRTSSAS